MSNSKAWEYMHANASLKHPQTVSFFEEPQQRLYRDVDLNVIGTHGWELVSVVLVPHDEGMRFEYFFKRPSRKETATIYEAADN
jgi:hypothetical protein